MGIDIFTEKYRPRNIKQFVGNESVVNVTKQFFISWKNGNPINKSLLYYGPPGTGKTTLALLLALNTGQELVHHNSSDLSRKEDLESLRHTTKLGTFDDKIRISIIDECDRIGKVQQKTLLKVLNETKQPIIMICNDITKIIYEIKKTSLGISFCMVPEYLIKKRLLQIATHEGKTITNDTLTLILKHNKSVRGAINALQEYFYQGEVSDSSRDLDFTNIDKLRYVLNGYPQDIQMPLKEITAWFTDSDLDDYETVSMLDVINNRVLQTQNYDLWDAGFAIVNTARGKLCDYPISFKNKYERHKNKPKEEIVVEKDEHIKFGKGNKSKKPSDEKIKFHETDDKNLGFGEFL